MREWECVTISSRKGKARKEEREKGKKKGGWRESEVNLYKLWMSWNWNQRDGELFFWVFPRFFFFFFFFFFFKKKIKKRKKKKKKTWRTSPMKIIKKYSENSIWFKRGCQQNNSKYWAFSLFLLVIKLTDVFLRHLGRPWSSRAIHVHFSMPAERYIPRAQWYYPESWFLGSMSLTHWAAAAVTRCCSRVRLSKRD